MKQRQFYLSKEIIPLFLSIQHSLKIKERHGNLTKIILLLCMVNMCSLPLTYAQGEFGKITAQSSDFVRYGLTPVSYFSGKVSVEIPLYTIQDPDFSIPLSLSYSSDGIKPSKHPGLVGLDWVFNFGGVITREVYGGPDDAYGYQSDENAVEKGFWHAIKEKEYTAQQLLTFDPSVIICDEHSCGLPLLRNGYYYDCQPDLFLFRFPGASGSFMIDNTGDIKSDCPDLKINLSGLFEQYVANEYPNKSTISITNSDGYSYLFGSDLSAMEYSITFKPSYNLPLKEMRPVVMAWHLVQITAPNGRVLKINYASSHSYPNYSPFWQASSSSDDEAFDKRSYSAVKGVYPSSITIPDTGVTIEFITSIETCRQFYIGFYDYNYPTYQLDMIRVKQGENQVYTYELKYENQQHLRFLKQVRLPDSGIYNLSYNHTVYPEPDTKKADFWGYWKEKEKTTNPYDTLIPLPPMDTMVIAKRILLPSREEIESAYGMLTKVNYPTGGYSEFFYERNQYQRRVDTNIFLNEFKPSLIQRTDRTGGFRISKIHHNSGEDATQNECLTFTYEDEQGIGSGILCQYPPYSENYLGDTIYMVSDIWHKNYNIEEQHIGYSSVKESFADGSFIRYTYTDYHTNPDTPQVFLKKGTKVDGLSLACSNANRVSSASQERGLLLHKEYYDKAGIKQKREYYSYQNLGGIGSIFPIDTIRHEVDSPITDTKDCIVSFRSLTGGALARKVYIKSRPIIENTVKTIVQGYSITSSTKYKYDTNNQLIEQVEACSDGSVQKRTYAYPTDWRTINLSNVYTQMAMRNQINKPVEEKSYLDDKPISAQKTTYRIDREHIVKDSTFIAKGNLSYNFLTAYPIYDSHGNPLLEVSRDGIYTVRIWGYKYRYLVAEIRNISYQDAENILNTVNPETFAAKESPDQMSINRLRTSYPEAHIYSYTYSPLVGLTSVTAPNGETETYQYDSAGRLIQTIDHSGKVVNVRNFHYKP